MTEDVPAYRTPPALPAAGARDPDTTGWQRLPARAHALFVASAAVGGALPLAIAGGVLGVATLGPRGALVALAAALAGAAFGAWLGHKRFRYTAWRLDDDGFALRRGKLFETETRVPGSRVQHLDLRRGPLQRRYRLATLVIHTAGTRHSEVTLSGLDVDDAQRLRDRLARQTDDGDDD